MDLEEIKKMINEGEKIIIVENGKPEIVIMNYSEYQKKFLSKVDEFHSSSSFPAGRLNEERTEEKFTINDLPII